MFRLKKLLYKLYHLIAFLGIFIFFISPVKADVTTCDDFLVSSSLSFQKWNNTWHGFTYNSSSSGYCIPYSSTGQIFYFKFFPTDTINFDRTSFLIRNVTSDSNSGTTISSNTNMDNNSYIFSASISSGSGCLRHVYIASDSFFIPIEGTPLLMSTNLSDIESCTLAPIEPEPPATDEIYSSFTTIFIDRFKYVADSCLTNPYLLAFIGVLVSWIILELFLHIIHIRGGYKK